MSATVFGHPLTLSAAEPGKVIGLGPALLTFIRRTRTGPDASPIIASVNCARTPSLDSRYFRYAWYPAAPAEVAAADDKQARKEPRGKGVEEPEDDEHKDGVSLDELFSMKPEIFQTAAGEEEESADKKKGKKGKKKSVELVLDEERGEVVGRKKHKRGDDDLGEDW